jgi:hypothetical protein
MRQLGHEMEAQASLAHPSAFILHPSNPVFPQTRWSSTGLAAIGNEIKASAHSDASFPPDATGDSFGPPVRLPLDVETLRTKLRGTSRRLMPVNNDGMPSLNALAPSIALSIAKHD